MITFDPWYSYEVEKFYKVEGFPKPTITWWKIVGSQEELLYNSTTNEYTYDDLYFDRGHIYFYGLSFPKDNATFKCVATNRMGSVSKSFALNILGKVTYRFSGEMCKIFVLRYYDLLLIILGLV